MNESAASPHKPAGPHTGAIREQVRLPLRVALEVVAQGLRIRLGRSLVTLTGVSLGIAFLMSILAGQVMRQGVGQEDRLRAEVSRMVNFLAAETGPLENRNLGVLVTGPLDPVEERFLLRLEGEGLTALNFYPVETAFTLPAGFRSLHTQRCAWADMGREASAVLVLGGGAWPEIDWGRVFQDSRQRVLAVTRPGPAIQPTVAGLTLTSLTKAPLPEELARQEEERGKARFRDGWIVIISLLVTVIGISNSMLMSVTERFREIGTMKCLGALSSFVRRLFLIESAILGLAGGLAGVVLGALFSICAYGLVYGFGLSWVSIQTGFWLLVADGLLALAAGLVLSVAAALYPAHLAARMVPAAALRSNV